MSVDYNAEREKYESSMDEYYDRLNKIAKEKYGKNYEDLDIHAKNDCESQVDDHKGSCKGSRKGDIYQLDNGKIVNKEEADAYKNNYANMMDAAWEEHKRKKRDGSRKGSINIDELDEDGAFGPQADIVDNVAKENAKSNHSHYGTTSEVINRILNRK